MQQLPYTKRCHGHLQLGCFIGLAISGHGVGYGIDHTRCCANGAQLTHAFDSQDIVGARNRLVGIGMEHGRHDVCTRCCVVHQTTGQQLTAFWVVNQTL